MNKKNCKILWFTGLSGVGKTSLSLKLIKKIKSKNLTATLVDGDIFRKKSKLSDKFTKKNIIDNNLKIIKFIKNKLISENDIILVAVISPLKKTRLIAKKTFGENYFEIYLKCNLSELIKRDTKGLYKLAKKGILKNLIGYNSHIKYETSDYKTISINTNKLTIQQSASLIISKLKDIKNEI